MIKGVNSNNNFEECIQHEHGKQWKLIDEEVRNVLTSCTPIMIKCITGINLYGNMIRMIDKSNATSVCYVCDENEGRDHFASCKKSKNNRDEWAKELEKKIKN